MRQPYIVTEQEAINILLHARERLCTRIESARGRKKVISRIKELIEIVKENPRVAVPER